MKKLLSICLVFFPFIISAQIEVGYLITDDGETIYFYENPTGKAVRSDNNVLYGDVNLTTQYVHYFNAEGKHKRFSQGKVREIEFNGLNYMKLPVNLGAKRLHEIIAINNEYLLTNYYNDGYYFYIFNKENLDYVVKLQKHSYSRKKDLKLLEKKIKPYFLNCPELITAIQKGIEESNYKPEVRAGAFLIKNNLFRFVSNYQCPE